jgi:hypothetical protein
LLTWYTVTVLTPHSAAASAWSRLSPNPSSKCSRILARVMLRAVCVPLSPFAVICSVRHP